MACRQATRLSKHAPRPFPEIVERHVKFRVFTEGLCLPDVPDSVVARYPRIAADIAALRVAGYGILVRDASPRRPISDTLRHIAQPEGLGVLLQLWRTPSL